ncbi:MAG: DUF5659 domain-containing protein [Nitrospirota bacterium]|nr:DUF5659 domain-containing protein [Nitrospirota bacterium]
MREENEEEFKTTDIFLASFIEVSGIPHEMGMNRSFVEFRFPATVELFDLVKKYNQNSTTVAIAEYIAVLRELKSKMYGFKTSSRPERLEAVPSSRGL